MSVIRKVTRASAEMKPPHGSPCNNCGVCCEVSLCKLAAHVFDVPPGTPGPCPALQGSPGAAMCGMVADPGRFMPVRTEAVGAQGMSDAALVVIGAGYGCDARINGEPINQKFYDQCDALDLQNARVMRIARRYWGMP